MKWIFFGGMRNRTKLICLLKQNYHFLLIIIIIYGYYRRGNKFPWLYLLFIAIYSNAMKLYKNVIRQFWEVKLDTHRKRLRLFYSFLWRVVGIATYRKHDSMNGLASVIEKEKKTGNKISLINVWFH